MFENDLTTSSLVRRRPYTAVKRISRALSRGDGDIIPATDMDALYPGNPKPPALFTSTGAALNLAVNELADVLHTFFLNVVDESN